jgi:nitrogen regulatory protein PII
MRRGQAKWAMVKILVVALEQVLRIRTGERGASAI